jgi:hypothetical protein
MQRRVESARGHNKWREVELMPLFTPDLIVQVKDGVASPQKTLFINLGWRVCSLPSQPMGFSIGVVWKMAASERDDDDYIDVP